ncbi:MAG: CAP domain-containing protein [Firmicutes bacterium]|nr:CAP domain-containing protein [Bacillota bacterium]
MTSVDLFIFMASVSLAIMAYPPISNLLYSASRLPQSYTNLMSFAALFALTYTTVTALASRYLYQRITKFVLRFQLRKTDSLLGMLPALVGGFIWLSIILGTLVWFPVSTYIKDSINRSIIGARIVKAATIIEPQVERIVGRAIEDTGWLKAPSEREFRANIPRDVMVSFNASAELYMLSLINNERRMLHLKALQFDPRIRDVARAHSLDMVKNNYFDHNSPTQGSPFDRLRSAGILFLFAGENLAYAQSIDIAHQNLMQSEGHRQNILHPAFGKVGIGIVDAGPYGYMITQDFTN